MQEMIPMKKWTILAPLGLAALGAAALVLTRKKQSPAAGAEKPAAAKAPAHLKTGSYSFISGFRNASTVEMEMDYDGDSFGFAVVEEDFLSYSSDSHVALVQGADFSLQIEYASYLSGEEADGQWSFLLEKHPDLTLKRWGGVEGAQYLEGDTLCFCLPIPEDGYSYVQVLLFKDKGNDTPLPEMAEDPALNAMLASVRFRKS
jgi:hypothetical protein